MKQRIGSRLRTVNRQVRAWVDDTKAKWHRAHHGWAPSDTWSLDVYLAKVIAESVAYLRDTCHGVPNDLLPVNEHGIEDDSPQALNAAAEKWDALLTEIVQACRSYAAQDIASLGEIASGGEKIRNAMHLLGDWYHHLWS